MKKQQEQTSCDVEQKVKATLAGLTKVEPETPVLLMVSGGSDSVALAYIAATLHEQGVLGPLAMLHVNHQLREDASEQDQLFVEALSELLGIPLFTCRIDIAGMVKAEKGNMEAIARRERYIAATDALQSMCAHYGLPSNEGCIFVAHTQNDRVENFYMRSIVGTGPGGFRAMRYTSEQVVRPLLDVSRRSLRRYIQARAEAGLPCVKLQTGELWCEDATNNDTDYFRSYVRHVMVPVAEERNPQLLDTLCRSMNLIADEDDFLEELAQKAAHSCVEWLECLPGRKPAYEDGFLLLPETGKKRIPIRRRIVIRALKAMLGPDARIESETVEAVLAAFSADGAIVSGYVTNIQGNLAVSANKHGVRVEPMAYFRARRKK